MKKCKQGYYYCYEDKKCKRIPNGYRVGLSGYLRKENEDEKEENGNHENGNGNGNGNSNGGSNGGGVSEGTLHKWFKGSKSKDGKGGWVNVVTGGTCASDEPGEGTPKCVSSAKRASMSKSERLSAARRKKKADPGQQQKSGAAKPTYVATDKKKMKKEEVEIIEGKDKKGKGSGTKDACYHKVKSRYSVWPSAYASGALVKCRKVGAANWGNKSESYEFSNWRDDFKATEYEFLDVIKPEPLNGEQIDEVMSPKEKGESERARSSSTLDMGRRTKSAYNAARGAMIAAKQLKRDAAELKNEEKIEEGQKCWKGYEKKGTKKMFGKTYNNCVKKEETEIEEKKDPCWDTHKQVGMKKKGGKLVPNCVPKEESNWRKELGEDWQKVNKGDKTDGMSQKAVNAYRRENPGSKLKTAVTGDPKPGSKDAKRRKSFCARSKGQQDMHNIDCSKDPDKPVCKARRRWKC